MTGTSWWVVAALALLLRPSALAHAETTLKMPQSGIIGEDNRQIVQDLDRMWTAIGQVNVQGYRVSERCSGTRVAPGLVLTAAHCVTDMQRKAPILPKNIHFVAGVNKDKNAGHAVADCVILPDDFNIEAKTIAKPDLNERLVSHDFLRRDIAMIVLKSDTQAAGLIPPAPQQLAAGQALLHAGYHRDRRQMLMVDEGCKVLGTEDDLIATDCDAIGGNSGAPVLVKTNGKLGVAAVMVGYNEHATLAVPLTVWPLMMKEPSCR